MSENEQPRYVIHVQWAIDEASDVPVERMQAAVSWVLARHEVTAASEISIVITSDDEVQALNRQFRGVDTPTDVLSFPAEPEPVPDDVELGEDEDTDYLGDLILSLPYIRRQAASEQHSVCDELLLAVIHGTLHLLEYDHDTAAHQEAMWELQSEALNAFGVAINVPRFEFPPHEQGDS